MRETINLIGGLREGCKLYAQGVLAIANINSGCHWIKREI